MFEWKPEFAVGMPHIDAQHRELFRLAEALYVAMSAGQGKAALEGTLDRLVKYTEEHFAAEERLMRLNDYTFQAAHKAEHRALTRKVVDFQTEFNHGRATLAVPVLQFLRSWLEGHIKQSDMKLAGFIRQRTAA